MPMMPPTFRPPGARTKQQIRRDYDTRRRRDKPWRRWYGTKQWREIRAAQLAVEPYCRRCKSTGRVVRATVCDHVQPHRGDWQRFIAGPFQSLCSTCHSSAKQIQEGRAVEA